MSIVRRVFRFRVTDGGDEKGWPLLVRLAVFLGLVGLTAGGLAVAGVYFYYAPTLPEFDSLADYQPKIGTRIYSADGQLIGEFAAERRVLVDYEQVPPLLFRAFISAEDKRFWSHGGVDFIGIAQAIFDKIRNPGHKLRGASTITQQVAKSLLAINESYEAATERSLERKIREALLALRLDHALTKEEILYLYSTQIFLGHQAYGVQAAAEHYFRKNVWELSLAEMATLAGLPQRPSDYSPASNPEKARARRKYVLRRMLEDGYVTQEQHDQAVAEEIVVYPREELYLTRAPYYTEQVRRELIERYGERSMLEDGLQVYTALNLEYQAFARAAVDRGLLELDKRQGFRGPHASLPRPKRALFVAEYREHLRLEGDAQLTMNPGESYLALVEGFDAEGRYAMVDVAGLKAYLPLAGMRWARKPNPTERVDMHYLTDVRKALAVGDVVTVKVTSRKGFLDQRHGGDVPAVIPEKAVLVRLEQEPIAQAALLSVDPRSGYVLAQVGGYDFADSTYNRAVQACREPGSAFKPVVYAAAVDKLDYTPSTLIDDKPIVFDDPDNAMRWKPDNAEQEFRGSLPMRTCLRDSINTPAIRIANAVGIDDIIKNARRMGITTPLKRELGTALGSSCTTLYDLSNVYVTVNQYGERRPLRFIRRVVDRYGNVLEDYGASWDPTYDLSSRLTRAYEELVTPPQQVLDRPTAYVMVSLLKNVVEGGTGVGAQRLGLPAAGKTGTTNDSYDAWFMGFTRHMVTGVWVGHDTKERPLGVSEQGGRTALPIWVDYMIGAYNDYTTDPPKKRESPDFPPPAGVVEVAIDPETGMLARPGMRSVKEYYRAGTEPTETAPDHSVLNIEHVDIYQAEQL